MAKDVKCVRNLYWGQTAVLRAKDLTVLDYLEIHRGVHQGCILSSLLFNRYSEHIFQETFVFVERDI